MKRIAVSVRRLQCDNCLDSTPVIVVVYDDGDARAFIPDNGATSAVALRRIVKAHQRRGYQRVTPEHTFDVSTNFVEVECPTCTWSEDIVVLVDEKSLDHEVVG